MATFRVGVGSFNINDGSVGIGTEGSGHGNLKVEGVIKSTKNLDVLGVSTFTRYSGFNADEINVNNRDLTLSGEYSTTGDIVVEDGSSLTVGLGSTACVGTVECISVKHHFSVPVGDTAQRNEISGYGEGTVRYNRDLGTMEFFNGNEWRQFTYTEDTKNILSSYLEISSCGRAVIHTGSDNIQDASERLEFLNISTFGNSLEFGALTVNRFLAGRGSSQTRGLHGGGQSSPTLRDVIDYYTIASEGDAIDFGNLSAAGRCAGGASSSTRALFAGVNVANVIDYVEISTLGDALDFGDLTNISGNRPASFSSPIRFVCASGHSTPNTGAIEFLNIASKGNTTKFGNLTYAGHDHGSARGLRGLSNSTRGLFAGGYRTNSPYAVVSEIDFVTIASEGNATSFGDMTSVRYNNMTTGSQTRGILAGGQGDAPGFARILTIDSVEYATTGSAVNFGELSLEASGSSANSDCHGGLGGY